MRIHDIKMASVSIINLAIILLVANCLMATADKVPLPIIFDGKEIQTSSQLQDLLLKYAKQCAAVSKVVIPSGFHHIGANYYYFSSYQANWHNAKVECERKGANLAHPKTWEENKKIRDYLRGDGNYWWIGGTDIGRKGIWKWVHDQSFVEYTDWGHQFPRPNADYNCLGFSVALHWWDNPCITNRHFICQI
ncbi:chromatin-modulating protein mrc1 [Chamberlinius hualienensis]